VELWPESGTRGEMTCARLGTGMELEHHQLDLRYEALRCRAPEREKRLLVSLAEHGQ